MFDRDRLSDTGRPHQKEDFALADVEIEAPQDRLVAERLGHTAKRNQRPGHVCHVRRATPEMRKSSRMTANEEAMTARVVALPTPCEPPRAPRPHQPATI